MALHDFSHSLPMLPYRALEETLIPAVAEVYTELRQSLEAATWAALEAGLVQLVAVGGMPAAPRPSAMAASGRVQEST